jgi:hypothetical protein
VLGADAEHESLALGVQQLQIAQRCRDLVRDDDVAGGLGDGEPSAAQIERRVLPVADHAGVVADAALPSDRRPGLGAKHDHATRAGPVSRAASARQRAFPGGAGVTCRGGPDDVAQVCGQSPGRAGGVLGQVEEVVQVGDHHPGS